MAEKIRHHYVPRFYLEKFVDSENKPYIWVYEKGNPVAVKASSKDIACEKYGYSFTDETGKRDSETIENALAELESNVAPVFEKIRNYEDLDKEDREIFSFFLAFMMGRVPGYRRNIENATAEFVKRFAAIQKADIEKKILRFNEVQRGVEEDKEASEGEKEEFTEEEIVDGLGKIVNGEYIIEINPEFSLLTFVVAKELVPVFYGMDWSFWLATDDYKYITSDNPMIYDDPTHERKSIYGVGLLNKNIEVTFPVAKDLVFVGNWKKMNGYKKTNNKIVKAVNRRIAASAYRFVFASENSEGLNTLVQKYKDVKPSLEVK